MKSANSLAALSWTVVALVLICFLEQSYGQGTTTVAFESQPRGSTSGAIGVYTESGMQFGMAYGPGSLVLSGGGIPGYADNGTGYLQIPDGVNARLRFGFNQFPQGSPLIPFNLLSFDAAEYGGFGPQTLMVVGYQSQTMGPKLMVTNFFTVHSQAFQTFHLDSSFANVYAVDVFNARWSLDNLVISGVPEPSCGALAVVAVLCALGRVWIRGRCVP